MTTGAMTIAGCCVITAAIKAAGPIALGGRELPTWFTSVVILLSPALLAALVATQVFAEGDQEVVDVPCQRVEGLRFLGAMLRAGETLGERRVVVGVARLDRG